MKTAILMFESRLFWHENSCDFIKRIEADAFRAIG